MKILMLNAPFHKKFSRGSRSPAVTKGGTIYYPIWLAYATGVLEKTGNFVKLIDAPARDLNLEATIEIAKELKPKLLVIDASTPSIHNDVKVLEAIKKAHNCFAVLVGTHPSALPVETLKMSKAIDAIARHEFDYTLRELVSELEKKKPKIKNVLGLSFRQKNKIIHNKDRPFIQDLDEMPFVSEVYKKHLRIEDYFYSANLYPEITIVTGRGCPFRCKFCVWPQVLNGRAYRTRSVENVIAEFEFIKKNFPQVKEVFIEDDTFTADRERAREFCRIMIEKRINLIWSANSRADVDFETLSLMKKAGCRLLCVGVESGEQRVLNEIRKGTTIPGIKQFMKDAKRVGILVHGCFMLGNQGDNIESIRKTIAFAKELDPDTAQFFPIMVYPGTETFDWAKQNNYLLSQNFQDWLNECGEHNCMVSRPGLTNKQLVELCDEARIAFYLRPKYIFSKALQALTKPAEFKRIVRSAATLAKHMIKKKK
jgi:radical SAM superfamily enzyme YgiQ (UPF0313 family)